MPSPAFRINLGAAGEDVAVTAAGAVTATVDDLTGVRSVEWSIVATDETTEPADYVLVPSGPQDSVVTTTALAAGTAAILRCRINAGIDPQTEQPSALMTASQVFYVLTSPGALRVKALGEDSTATARDVAVVNGAVRKASAGSVPSDISTNSATLAEYVAIGDPAEHADAGEIRLDDVATINGRTGDLLNNAALIRWGVSAAETLDVGDRTYTAAAHLHVKATGFVTLKTDNVEFWRFDDNIFTAAGNSIVEVTSGFLALSPSTSMFLDSGSGSVQLRPAEVCALSAEPLAGSTTGIAFFTTTGSYGGGRHVAFFANANTNPSTNPTGGFILYGDAGAAKIRGSGGTVTTAGPAEPHCTKCGRDYAFEARNDDAGEHLAICWPCLLDALEASGISTGAAFIRDLQPKKKREANLAAAQKRHEAREAAEAARPKTRRELWAERKAAEAWGKRQQAAQAVAAQRALDLATMASAAVGDDDEEAAFLLAESAEAWAKAGGAEQQEMAMGLALAVAPAAVRAELEGAK